MNMVNIFTRYAQEENHFTNALIATLSLSRFADPGFLPSFLARDIQVDSRDEVDTFSVLKGIVGTADGEIRNQHCCIQFETKIVSGCLRRKQVRQHLTNLKKRPEPVKKLVLLTPDNSGSRYVERFVSLDADLIVHLPWKRVYTAFESCTSHEQQNLFSELVRQFLCLIHARVFEQDFVGIILKVDFGKKSDVWEDSYLDKLRSGDWTYWNTPREYKSLDGTGRKLLFFDRTRAGITAEVEIEKVKRTDEEVDYPWANMFAPGTLRVFDQPIVLDQIRLVKGLDNFGIHRKDRSPFRKLTHEQYLQLTNQGGNAATLTGHDGWKGEDSSH